MSGETFGWSALFAFGLQLLKEVRHSSRIVPAIVKNVHPNNICLASGVPRVLKKNRVDCGSGADLC